METILQILKQNSGRFVSGEFLAKTSGITRAGIWKRIEQLREIGYQIDSLPHQGYCLKEVTSMLHPLELKANLKTHIFGRKIFYRPEVDSTNNWARAAAVEGEDEGAIFIAETQTKGKGRLGREWFSLPGLGLWMSLLARPRVTPHELSVINLLTAVAAAQAIKEVTGIQVQLKWPNDLVFDGRKLGGILAELNGEMDLVHFLIIGIGLNINHTADHFPPELTEKAISLKIINGGAELSRHNLFREFLAFFEEAYAALSTPKTTEFIQYATRNSATLGKIVTVHQGNRMFQGKALEMEPDGSLRLLESSGNTLVIHSGEIIETSGTSY